LSLLIFLFDQKQPKPGNGSCGIGLALGFSLHKDACVVSEHIGRYSTPCMKYVNDFLGTLLKLVDNNKNDHRTIRKIYISFSIFNMQKPSRRIKSFQIILNQWVIFSNTTHMGSSNSPQDSYHGLN